MISKYIKPSAAFSAVAVLIAGGGLAQLAPTNPNPGVTGGPYSPPGGSSCPCPPPNDCSGLTSTTSETGSVYFNMNLGRTSFSRNFNYFRAGAIPSKSLGRSMRMFALKPYVNEYPESLNFYKKSATTARRNYQLYLAKEDITADIFQPKALAADDESGAETLYDTAGAVRQILTDDVFADIQPISAVWSGLPSDIKGVVPSTAAGFVVQTWLADGMSASTGGLHALPTSDRLAYYVFYNPDSSLGAIKHLAIIQKAQYGGNTTSYKNKTWVYEQDSNHNWVTKQYPSIPSTIPSSTLPLDEIDIAVTGWTAANPNAFVQTRTHKQLPFNPDGTFGTSLMIVSVDKETYSNVGGLSRLTEKISDPDGAARVTKYGYYDASGDDYTYGRLKWQYNPDASFEYNIYSGFDNVLSAGTIIKYTPARNYKWTPGDTAPDASKCQREIINLTQTSSISTTSLDGVTIACRSESTTNDGTTSIVTEKVFTDDMVANALVTTTGYYYDATFTLAQSNKIKWRELPDGTAEVYSYVTNSSGGTTDTIYKGAGDRTGVTQGTKVVQERNRRGEITRETTYYLNGGGAAPIQMSEWVGTSFDTFGRVLHRIWNGDTTDTESFAYNCCGLTSYTDRRGIVSEYTRDDLRRVSNTRVTAGSWTVENQTTFHEATGGGLITTESKKGTLGASTLTALIRETKHSLGGEVTQILTPDQNNDGIPETTNYSYTYATDSSPSATSDDGRVVTATYPDGGQVTTSYMVDGRKHSTTGNAVPDEEYSYLTYNSAGGFHTGTGLVISHIKLSASGGADQREDTYYDYAGRVLKVSFPNHTGSGGSDDVLKTYYPSSAPAGCRNQLMTHVDSDGVVKNYSYDALGHESAVASLTPSGGTQTTSVETSAIGIAMNPSNTAPFIGPAYQAVNKTSDGTSSITTSIHLTGGYERMSRETSFHQVSTSILTLGSSSGSWTESSTRPSSTSSYTTEVREFVNGLLASDTRKDSSGGIVSGESYSYDALGRLSSKQDLRTGIGGNVTFTYTAAGGILSCQEANGRGGVYTRDKMGRVLTEDRIDSTNHSLGQVVSSSYYPTGLLQARWGKLTYPIFYVYDEQNRMVEMRTYQGLNTLTQPIATTGGYASTIWTYNPSRGWLDSKSDAASHAVYYTHTASGRLVTRTDSRGNVTTYSYVAGYLTSRIYNPVSNTPNIAYVYDGFGRLLNVTQTDAVTSKVQSMFDYHYSPSNFQMDYEIASYIEQPTAGTFSLVRKIDHLKDSLDRRAGVDIAAGTQSTIETSSAVTYSPLTGLIDTISGPSMGSFTYSYVQNSEQISKIDTGLFTRNYSYDPTRDLISGVENKIGASTIVSKFSYAYNDLAQRESLLTSGTAFSGSGDWAWEYNDRGEVRSADSSLNTFDRAYQYDGIGNRQKSVEGGLTLPVSNNYASNSINQYTAVASGTTPTYDADGNQISGNVTPVYAGTTAGTMSWDAENRLVSVTSSGSTVKFYYDAFGRRIAKQIPNGADGLRYGYVYDGWNVIGQYYLGTPTVVSVQPVFFNMWGPDLSGSWSGAGGTGGLLAVRGGSLGKTYDVTYDANGNISEYVKVDSSGLSVAAHFEYDAFGKTLKDSDSGLQFEFRFSTKPIDWNCGLIYYGYRYNDPMQGRWLSMDPIQERGGANLYGFIGNDGINAADLLGLVIKFNSDKCSGDCAEAEKTKFNKALEKLSKTGPLGNAMVIVAKSPKYTLNVILCWDGLGPTGGNINDHESSIALPGGKGLGWVTPEDIEQTIKDGQSNRSDGDDIEEIILGHELGHAIFDFDDPGVVTGVENPLRDEMGKEPRKTYIHDGKDIGIDLTDKDRDKAEPIVDKYKNQYPGLGKIQITPRK